MTIKARRWRLSEAGRALRLALSLSFALTGCGAAWDFLTSPAGVLFQDIAIEVEPGINDNRALAVDLVFVYDRPLLARIEKLTAREWFAGKAGVLNDFPSGYETVGWELSPGQKAPHKPSPSKAGFAVGVFLFADYRDGGPHRARLGEMKTVTVVLGAKEFTVRPSP